MTNEQMTDEQLGEFADVVACSLGSPQMTWDGDGPQDFRKGSARFVHSDLFYQPEIIDGTMEFKILVNDSEFVKAFTEKVRACGWVPEFQQRESETAAYDAVGFRVPIG